MLKTTLIVTAILGVFAVIGFAWAKHKGYCPGSEYLQQASERVSRKLDLNDEQNAKLQEFATTLRGLREDWTKGRAKLSDEIRRLLASPTLDRSGAMALLEKPHEAMAGRKQEIVAAFADFSDSLQPEQRGQLADVIAERVQHRWRHPGRAH